MRGGRGEQKERERESRRVDLLHPYTYAYTHTHRCTNLLIPEEVGLFLEKSYYFRLQVRLEV